MPKFLTTIVGSKRLTLLLISLIFVSMYLTTMPRENVGYADSDVLMAAAYQGGVAHPPGYPVYMLLLRMAMHLPIPMTSPVLRAHMLSMLFSIGALCMVFLSVWELQSRKQAPHGNSFTLLHPTFERWIISLMSVGIVGLTFGYWIYAQVAEKYALSTLLVTVLMYALIRTLLAKTHTQFARWWIASLGVFGLGLAHQQAIVFMIPAMLYVYLVLKPSTRVSATVKGTGLLLGLFGLSYVLAFAMQSVNPAISWNFDPSWDGLLDMILRRPFSGTRYTTGEMVSAYWGGVDIGQSLAALQSYLLLLYQQMGLHSVVLLVLSLVYAYFRRDRLSTTVLLAALGMGPILAAYIRWPEDFGTQAVTLRQYIPGFAMLALLASYGLSEFVWRIGRLFTDIGIHTIKASMALLVIFVVALGIHTWIMYPKADLSDYTLLHERYHTMLESFGDNAVVTCYSDISCFALLYEQSVHGLRPDVSVVPLAYQYVSQTIADPDIKGFAYPDNPFQNFDVVTWNLGKRPVYAVELNDYYYNFYGFSYPFMYYIPHDSYGEITRFVPDMLPVPNLDVSSQWLAYDVPSIDSMRLHHKTTISRDLLLSALVFYKSDEREVAEELMRRATSIYYSVESEQGSVDSIRSSMGQTQPLRQFAVGTSTESADAFLERYAAYTEKKLPNRAYGAALGAVAQDPTSVEARLRLATVYEELTDYRFAYIEYSHVLLLDPDNEEAKDGQERMLVYRQ